MSTEANTARERAKFWADDFDGDLLKLVPGVEEIVGEASDIVLYTYGGTTHGRLNHPAVWNDYRGMIAFFGFDPSGSWKPEAYYAGHRELVECTFLEALRDGWTHNFVMIVEGMHVWDGFSLSNTMMNLLYHKRGWKQQQSGNPSSDILMVKTSILYATQLLIGLRDERQRARA